MILTTRNDSSGKLFSVVHCWTDRHLTSLSTAASQVIYLTSIYWARPWVRSCAKNFMNISIYSSLLHGNTRKLSSGRIQWFAQVTEPLTGRIEPWVVKLWGRWKLASLVFEAGISCRAREFWRWLRTIQRVETWKRKFVCRQERWHIIMLIKMRNAMHLSCQLLLLYFRKQAVLH